MSLPIPHQGRDPWAGLTHDPRLPEHAHLRAADRDREAVAQVLAEAYADGRLTAEEHQERAGALVTTKTLGELPPLVADLVWVPPPQPWATRAAGPVHGASPELRARAEATYARERRSAWWTMVWVSAVCTLVWAVGALGGSGDGLEFDPGFFWPAFVMLFTAFHYGGLVVGRRQRIEEETARLERKAAKRELRARRRRGELPPA